MTENCVLTKKRPPKASVLTPSCHDILNRWSLDTLPNLKETT